MVTERRRGERVTFERGIAAHMMGIDGTWRRDCTMEDISETGAKLTIEGSVEGLHLKEFFLLLSSTGLAYPAASWPGSTATKSESTSSRPATRKRRRVAPPTLEPPIRRRLITVMSRDYGGQPMLHDRNRRGMIFDSLYNSRLSPDSE